MKYGNLPRNLGTQPWTSKEMIQIVDLVRKWLAKEINELSYEKYGDFLRFHGDSLGNLDDLRKSTRLMRWKCPCSWILMSWKYEKMSWNINHQLESNVGNMNSGVKRGNCMEIPYALWQFNSLLWKMAQSRDWVFPLKMVDLSMLVY